MEIKSAIDFHPILGFEDEAFGAVFPVSAEFSFFRTLKVSGGGSAGRAHRCCRGCNGEFVSS